MEAARGHRRKRRRRERACKVGDGRKIWKREDNERR